MQSESPEERTDRPPSKPGVLRSARGWGGIAAFVLVIGAIGVLARAPLMDSRPKMAPPDTAASSGPLAVARVVIGGRTELSVGDVVELRVFAWTAAGEVIEGRRTTWVSSDPRLRISVDGLVDPLAPGRFTVTAEVEGVTATTAIFVSAESVGTTATPPPVNPPPLPPDEEGFASVPVHYATDRLRTGESVRRGFYGGDRNPEGLEFGRALVSIPMDRETGELPRPKLPWDRAFPDPDEYVMLLNLTPMDRATGMRDIRAAIERSADNAVLIFIHGFNVGFDDSLLRTAQLAYDLDESREQPSFAPVAFSWPSNDNGRGYSADREDADWAAAHLAEFLIATKEELGAERVHIIAHSMGARVLVEALEVVQQQGDRALRESRGPRGAGS